MEPAAYRDRFPILESTTYLINHSLGAMPAEAERRLDQFAREWKTRGARAWGEGWWDTVFRVGDLIGGIIGALANTREITPLIAGVALSAQVGASFTAEIGSMRISEEIDALEVMSIPSLVYLVSTRIVALVAALVAGAAFLVT